MMIPSICYCYHFLMKASNRFSIAVVAPVSHFWTSFFSSFCWAQLLSVSDLPNSISFHAIRFLFKFYFIYHIILIYIVRLNHVFVIHIFYVTGHATLIMSVLLPLPELTIPTSRAATQSVSTSKRQYPVHWSDPDFWIRRGVALLAAP